MNEELQYPENIHAYIAEVGEGKEFKPTLQIDGKCAIVTYEDQIVTIDAATEEELLQALKQHFSSIVPVHGQEEKEVATTDTAPIQDTVQDRIPADDEQPETPINSTDETAAV